MLYHDAKLTIEEWKSTHCSKPNTPFPPSRLPPGGRTAHPRTTAKAEPDEAATTTKPRTLAEKVALTS